MAAVAIEYAKIFRKFGSKVTMLVRGSAMSALERIGLDTTVAEWLLKGLENDGCARGRTYTTCAGRVHSLLACVCVSPLTCSVWHVMPGRSVEVMENTQVKQFLDVPGACSVESSFDSIGGNSCDPVVLELEDDKGTLETDIYLAAMGRVRARSPTARRSPARAPPAARGRSAARRASRVCSRST